MVFVLRSIGGEVVEFFVHWYVGGFHAGSHWLINFLERLDRFFAFGITWRYFGQPLFQDRTAVGYILGFVFRLLRLLLGGIVYFVVIVLAMVLYLLWSGIPLYILYKVFNF